MPSRLSEGVLAGVGLRNQRQQNQDLIAKQIEKQSDQANKAIKGVLTIASDLNKRFREGSYKGTSEKFQEQMNNLLNVAKRTSVLGTQAGLSVMDPETLEAQRQILLSSPTPEQLAETKGVASAAGKVAGARTVTEKTSGTGADVPFSDALSASGVSLTPSQKGDRAPSLNDIILPLLAKVQINGVEALNDNEWATLELAARHTSGVDIEINRLVRKALKDRDPNASVAPEDVQKRFDADDSIPEGAKLGAKSEKGFEVIDQSGNLIGHYK